MYKTITGKLYCLAFTAIVIPYFLLGNQNTDYDSTKIIAQNIFNPESDNRFHKESVEKFAIMGFEGIKYLAFTKEHLKNPYVTISDVFGLTDPEASYAEQYRTLSIINFLGGSKKRISPENWQKIKDIPKEIRQKANSNNHYIIQGNGEHIQVESPYPNSMLKDFFGNMIKGTVASAALGNGTTLYSNGTILDPINNLKLSLGGGLLFALATLPNVLLKSYENKSIPHYDIYNINSGKRIKQTTSHS